MDGMLYVAFFFPVILSFSIFVNWVMFIATLWIGFGSLLASGFAESSLATVLPVWVRSTIVLLLGNPPLKKYGHVVYPLVLNFVHIATVMGSYSLGKALYNKRGWSMVQPWRGGVRFVLLQTILWCVFAVALCVPWLNMESFGLMTYFGAVESSHEDDSSFGGLLVSSAAMGMLAQSLVTVALMVYEEDKSGKPEPQRVQHALTGLRSLETGRWNFAKMFGEASDKFWWLFLASQTSLVLFSLPIATLADREIQNKSIRGLMAMVLVSVLIVALSLTNAVGGKWRHGERRFHMFMPFRGGGMFMVLQALGWCFFGLAITTILAEFYDLSFVPSALGETLVQSSLLGTAGAMGFASQLLIAVSLFFFDPNKVGESIFLQQLEKASPSSRTTAAAAAAVGSRRRDSKGSRDVAGGSRDVAGPGPGPGSGSGSGSPSGRGPGGTGSGSGSGSAKGAGVRRRAASSGSRRNVAGNAGRRPSASARPRGAWVIQRIIGKRPKPDTEGAFEFLVQWQAPARRSDWLMLQTMLAKTGSAAVHEAINSYERQRSQAGQLSDEEVEEDLTSSEAESPSDEMSSDGGEGEGGPEPPARTRGRRASQQQQRQQAVARRGRSKTPTPSRSSAANRNSTSSCSSDEHEWEECEDEMGNVYYYCLTTGKTVHELPA